MVRLMVTSTRCCRILVLGLTPVWSAKTGNNMVAELAEG